MATFAKLVKWLTPAPTPPMPAPRPRLEGAVRRSATLARVMDMSAQRQTVMPLQAAACIAVELCEAVMHGEREPASLHHLSEFNEHEVTLYEDGTVQLGISQRLRLGATDDVSASMTIPRFAVMIANLFLDPRSRVARRNEQPRLERAKVPPELEQLLLAAVDLDPTKWPTAAQLRDALEPLRLGWGKAQLAGWVHPFLITRFVKLPQPSAAVTRAEQSLLDCLRSGDETARLVYADWLCEQGRGDEGAWLQLEHAARTAQGDELRETLRALQPLTKKLGAAFLARVARPSLEGCPVRFGFKCPLTWEALERTADDQVRFCRGCDQNVTWCSTVDEARTVAHRGGCVAISPTVKRAEGDLKPPRLEVAMMGSVVG